MEPEWVTQAKRGVVLPSESLLKERFAEELLRRPNDAMQIATELAKGNFQLAWTWHIAWPHDPIVKAKQAELIEAFGDESFLPTKTKVAWDLYNMAHEKTDSGRWALEPKDRIKALEVYAEIRGFGQEHANSGNNVQQNINLNFVAPQGNESKVIDHQDSTQTPILPKLRFVGESS